MKSSLITTMAQNCSTCGRFMSLADGVECSVCGNKNHRGCVCRVCHGNTASSVSTETTQPVIESCCLDESMDTSFNVTAANITHEIDINSELRLFRAEMRATREQMSLLTTQMATLLANISATNKRIDVLELRVSDLEQNSADVSALRSTISQLKMDLNDRDQELLSNDIEISGIPEEKSENPMHLVALVGTALGVRLAACDVVHAIRVGPIRIVADSADGPVVAGLSPLRPPAELADGPAVAGVSRPPSPTDDVAVASAARPRPLVVRFTRRALRDDVLREARVRRNLTTTNFGLVTPSRRFYVNERLTRQNRYIFAKAREAGKLKGWRYIWSKEGRIFARQRPGMMHHRIRSEEDIERVFQSTGVSSEISAPLA